MDIFPLVARACSILHHSSQELFSLLYQEPKTSGNEEERPE